MTVDCHTTWKTIVLPFSTDFQNKFLQISILKYPTFKTTIFTKAQTGAKRNSILCFSTKSLRREETRDTRPAAFTSLLTVSSASSVCPVVGLRWRERERASAGEPISKRVCNQLSYVHCYAKWRVWERVDTVVQKFWMDLNNFHELHKNIKK